ncbi:hypothetical protein Ancab_030061 [Ancistrocladus abbreviatus]
MLNAQNQSQIPTAARRDGSGDIQLILPIQHSHQYRLDNSPRLLGSRRILRIEAVVFLFTKLHSLSRDSLSTLLLQDLIQGDMTPEYVFWGHLTFIAVVYNSGLLHRRSLQERPRLIFGQVKLTLASLIGCYCGIDNRKFYLDAHKWVVCSVLLGMKLIPTRVLSSSAC